MNVAWISIINEIPETDYKMIVYPFWKEFNGKEVSLQHGKIKYTYDELGELKDATPKFKNVNELFKQIVKDFKISEADKPQLFRLLTDFSPEHLFKSEGSYEFIAFLHNYNFNLHF